MEFKEAIGAIIAAIVLLVPAVKWLIRDWANKAEEIEKLKAKHAATALNRLEDDVKGFRSAIDGLQVQIRDLSVTLLASKTDIAVLKERLDDTKKMLENYALNVDGNIRNMIKTEVTNLTKQLMLIRNKKSGI